MPVIEVKIQTRFMVLFTSGSLLTWGKPLDASPGVSPRYLPAITLSFTDITLWQSMPFSYRNRLVEKRYGSPVGGISVFNLHCVSFKFPVIPRWNCPP